MKFAFWFLFRTSPDFIYETRLWTKIQPIWKGDLAAANNGIVILGTPVGHPEFVQRFLDSRLKVQSRFWDRLKEVTDLQAAWLLLLYCAVPRANHLIRALPPDVVADTARAHDEGICATFLDRTG